MRRTIIAGAALTASLALAGTAQADTVTTTFDGPEKLANGTNGPDWVTGSVNGQYGWTATNSQVDQSVVGVNGNRKLRVSNAYTVGSFGDMPHSKPVLKAAGENEATNVLVNEFTIQSAVPGAQQPGLSMSVSPDDGQGSRMSYLRFEDQADGIHVFFVDDTSSQDIATLDRGNHKIKFETTFVHGHDNDVVRIFIDDDLKVRGGSWENYYRFDEERNPSLSDRLLFRTAGTAATATRGSGFLIDDVTSTSAHVDNPAPLHPVVLPQGPKGDTGAAGQRGEQGAKGEPGMIVTTPTTPLSSKVSALHGNKLRTIHAPQVNGMKFVSVKASLRGKRLSVKGRAVKVDLRSSFAGNYDVQMTAKYRKDGKIVTVRSVRTLQVTL
jgi:hypothetical protein